MSFRFLHLADVHLETHFGGRAATRERLRRATLEAFKRAVDLALERRLHAVLVAGDLYDDPLLSPRTELELVRQVSRLTENGVWFLWACGNHDPGGPHKRSVELGLDGLERVHVFRKRRSESVVVTDADGVPVGAVVGAGHPTEREEQNLAAGFPPQHTDLPVVGLLHTQIETAQRAERHARYAPSTESDLARQGFAYWALGHVHMRQRATPDAPAWYSGNLQGRNANETGPKGGLLVDAEATGFAEPTFVALAPVRWERRDAPDLESASTLTALTERLTEAISELRAGAAEELAVRLDLSGRTLFAPLLRNPDKREILEEELAERTGAIEVQLEDRGLAAPRDMDTLTSAPSVLGTALGLIGEARCDDRLLRELAPDLLGGAIDLEEQEGWMSLSGEDHEAARLAYLRSLLAGLDEELLERCLSEESG